MDEAWCKGALCDRRQQQLQLQELSNEFQLPHHWHVAVQYKVHNGVLNDGRSRQAIRDAKSHRKDCCEVNHIVWISQKSLRCRRLS